MEIETGVVHDLQILNLSPNWAIPTNIKNECGDRTRDLQILNLTLSKLNYLH